MSAYMQIVELAKIASVSTPPTQWRVLQSIDKSYSLEFTFAQPGESPDWMPIYKQAKKIKNYKTIKSLISDIKKVSINALVHFEFQ